MLNPHVPRYPTPPAREIAFDALRGFLIVTMTLDHLVGRVGGYVYESLGFVSSAEGFVFLSGYMAAWVYGRIHDPQTRTRKIWRRAGLIYCYHVLVLLLLAGLYSLDTPANISWNPHLHAGGASFWERLPWVLMLAHQPGLNDILPMYVLCMLLLPMALNLLAGNRAGILLAVSVALWCAAQLGLRPAIASRLPETPLLYAGYFDLAAWQLLFVIGVVLGFRRCRGLPLPGLHSRVISISTFILLAGLLSLKHGAFGTLPSTFDQWVNKPRLGLLRIVNIALLSYLIAIGLTYRAHWFRVTPLVFLGRHSLQVFAFHVLLIYSVMPFRTDIYHQGLGAEIVVAFLVLASLALPALVHQRWLAARARRVRMPRLPAVFADQPN